MSLLLDAYGELLTEKQRGFLRRYFEEDLSFGEIAAQFDVSRQAIFDSVKHGESTLEHYESVLHLVAARKGEAESVSSSAKNSDLNNRNGTQSSTLRRCAAELIDLAEQLSHPGACGLGPALPLRLEAVAAELAGLSGHQAIAAQTSPEPAEATSSKT